MAMSKEDEAKLQAIRARARQQKDQQQSSSKAPGNIAHRASISGKNQADKGSKEKSLPLAIGLNFIFPGFGYFYLGEIYRGILALILVPAILLSTGMVFLIQTWIGLNVVMAIDMMILHNKHKQKVLDQNTKKCPYCAELIQKDAVLCKHCKSSLA